MYDQVSIKELNDRMISKCKSVDHIRYHCSYIIGFDTNDDVGLIRCGKSARFRSSVIGNKGVMYYYWCGTHGSLVNEVIKDLE